MGMIMQMQVWDEEMRLARNLALYIHVQVEMPIRHPCGNVREAL